MFFSKREGSWGAAIETAEKRININVNIKLQIVLQLDSKESVLLYRQSKELNEALTDVRWRRESSGTG